MSKLIKAITSAAELVASEETGSWTITVLSGVAERCLPVVGIKLLLWLFLLRHYEDYPRRDRYKR